MYKYYSREKIIALKTKKGLKNNRLANTCINNNAMANLNYSVMEMRRNNATGTLQSIIIKAPTNITNKISRATNVLDNMMVEYLKEIQLILKKILLINGYNTKTKIIDNSNIRPYNYVESKNYTFDCF
jgi:hypothetical protein